MFKLAGITLLVVAFIYLESRYIDLVREIKEYRLIKLKKIYPKMETDTLQAKFEKEYKSVSHVDKIVLILAIVGVFLLLVK